MTAASSLRSQSTGSRETQALAPRASLQEYTCLWLKLNTTEPGTSALSERDSEDMHGHQISLVRERRGA